MTPLGRWWHRLQAGHARWMEWLTGQQRAAVAATEASQQRQARLEAELARWTADGLLGLGRGKEQTK